MRPIQVLVVDEDPLTRESVAKSLAGLGMQVTSVDSARAALEMCSGTYRFDVILSDTMPDMSGVQLAQTLRGQHPAVPVILMTGWESVIDRAIEAGAVPLIKPFTTLQLKAVIDDVLEDPSSS